MIRSADLFASLATLADPVRCRIMLLLEKRELSVAEMVGALQLPQSTVSRHLKALADEGLVSVRGEGASNRYRMRLEQGNSVRRLWSVVREQTSDLAAAAEDARRLDSVLAERRNRSQAYFSTAAGSWDRTRSEMFGAHTHLLAFLALLDPSSLVGDLGCGTGQIAHTLAPFVKSVIAVDDSSAMLAAARKRLANLDNVDVRKGDLLDLPLRNGELDIAVMFVVLPYLDQPAEALREAQRVLRPGGRLIVVDMVSHDRDDVAHEMGHMWRGFSREQMETWGRESGFEHIRYLPLPPDAAARGPSLFTVTARKAGAPARTQTRRNTST